MAFVPGSCPDFQVSGHPCIPGVRALASASLLFLLSGGLLLGPGMAPVFSSFRSSAEVWRGLELAHAVCFDVTCSLVVKLTVPVSGGVSGAGSSLPPPVLLTPVEWRWSFLSPGASVALSCWTCSSRECECSSSSGPSRLALHHVPFPFSMWLLVTFLDVSSYSCAILSLQRVFLAPLAVSTAVCP